MELNFNFDTEKNDKDLFTIDKDEPQTLTLFESLEIQKVKFLKILNILKNLREELKKRKKVRNLLKQMKKNIILEQKTLQKLNQKNQNKKK